jgi:hypothetical protein
MENLIIKNLLEQVQRLTDENNMLKEKLCMKESSPIIYEETAPTIIKETPANIYVSIEQMITEKYTDALNIDEFEAILKTKVTENDLFDCIYKNLKDITIDILTRELSNKENRPIHKNKYYVVKINNEWCKKEYFDFNKIIKRLVNIVNYGLMSQLHMIKKKPEYINGGAGTHSYKNHKFDCDELKLILLADLNLQVISKTVGDRLHINL